MGSSASKAAAAATRRRFPARPAGTALPSSTPGHRSEPASSPRKNGPEDPASTAPDDSAATPSADFSRRLHQMGIVDTASYTSATNGPPVFPASGSNNITLSALHARRALQHEVDREMEPTGRLGTRGKRFLDMRTIVDALQLRHQGIAPSEIESRLRLRPGSVSKLGPPSVLRHLSANG